MNIELHPHQSDAVKRMKNGCILKGGVGSGKSRVSIFYWFTRVCGGWLPVNGKGELLEFTTPTDLYIITTAKKRDSLEWNAELADLGISIDDPEASFGGVRVVVDSWNNISKYKDVDGGFFIFDEQRLVGSGSWVKSFLSIVRRNSWILLSATPGDSWLDYIPVFIAHGYFNNRTEFINRHCVYSYFGGYPKLQRFVDEAPLFRYRDAVLVDMPFAKHTTRHIKNIHVEHDEKLFREAWNDRWHIFECRPIRDAGELFRVVRELVNSDPSRLGAILELVETHPRLIIFYSFDYELEILRSLKNTTTFEVREWNGHKHEPVPTSDRWIYLVQYGAGAEGWNCTTTNAICFYSLTYSYKQFEQSLGRIDRMNTPFSDLYYFVLRSSSKIDQLIQKAISQKKNFNEKGAVQW